MRSKNVLLLIILALCWGPSFFFIKIILEEIPTFTLVTLRLSIATCILYLIIKAQKKKLTPFLKYWKEFVIMGFFASALPFCLITYSETKIPSSLAGIINGSPPIFTAILAHIFLENEKMSFKKISGILVGFLGILVVFMPSILKGLDANITGISLVVIASISYSIAMVFSRKKLSHLPNLIGPIFQVMMGALIVLPFSIFVDKSYTLSIPSPKIITAIFSLAILGTVLSFTIYYVLLKTAGATYLSTSTLLFPFVSIFLGVVFLKETLGWNEYLGCSLILLGLTITNSLIKAKDLTSLFKVKKLVRNKDKTSNKS